MEADGSMLRVRSSGVLKPLNNSQKGRRMISKKATGMARGVPFPPVQRR
jgi:hypothetical protein